MLESAFNMFYLRGRRLSNKIVVQYQLGDRDHPRMKWLEVNPRITVSRITTPKKRGGYSQHELKSVWCALVVIRSQTTNNLQLAMQCCYTASCAWFCCATSCARFCCATSCARFCCATKFARFCCSYFRASWQMNWQGSNRRTSNFLRKKRSLKSIDFRSASTNNYHMFTFILVTVWPVSPAREIRSVVSSLAPARDPKCHLTLPSQSRKKIFLQAKWSSFLLLQEAPVFLSGCAGLVP